MKELQKQILTDLMLEAKRELDEVNEVLENYHRQAHVFSKMVVTFKDPSSGAVMVLLEKDGSVYQRASHLNCSDVYKFDEVSSEAIKTIHKLTLEPESYTELRAFEFKTFMFALKDIRFRRAKSLQAMVNNAGYRGTPEKMRCQ